MVMRDPRRRFFPAYAGLLPHTDVEFVFDGTSVRIVRSERNADQGRGSELLEHQRGSATVRLSTDKIGALTLAPCPRCWWIPTSLSM